jgi:glucuronate isomerase
VTKHDVKIAALLRALRQSLDNYQEIGQWSSDAGIFETETVQAMLDRAYYRNDQIENQLVKLVGRRHYETVLMDRLFPRKRR